MALVSAGDAPDGGAVDAKEAGDIGAAATRGEHAENFGSLMRHKPVAFGRDFGNRISRGARLCFCLPEILTDGHRAGAKLDYRSVAIPHPAVSPIQKAPLSRWGHRYLGQELFPETLSALEIEHFFTLDEQELARVRERRGPLNRLALALHIGFLKMTGNTLNSVERIPAEILDRLGRQLDCTPPRIASIRAFYRRRRRTLFEHHAAALRLLGRRELTSHAERGFVAYIRREATAVFDQVDLMACARTWLVEHDYLLLRERDIRRHVIAARRNHEHLLFKVIAAIVPSEREDWVPRLLGLIEGGEVSHLEWLGAVPSSRATKGLEEQIEKVAFLKELGADRLILPDLPLVGLEHFSRRMTSRKPAALTQIRTRIGRSRSPASCV